MDQLLENYKLPKLAQCETDCMNHVITIKNIKIFVRRLLKKKSPDPGDFTGRVYQTFLRINNSRTSQVAQWLRIHLPMQGTQV